MIKILSLLAEYSSSIPERETAFNIALKLERSASELHYQDYMNTQNDDNVYKQLMQRLNRGDKDHASRLLAYMSEQGIETMNINLV